ncbi:hypothetical Protein YC6258_01963 [Gynuella sunshinyii YC6258]|uniref:Uncharacterized protein n=1 Tax=Gynuella sunshinyii YC6258 TaxID=1445510 RepID=A0A0C5VH81_9GAMM|nr:hypothetical Protein YC6258_01963 [Gynuella sunshinyii YC6258]
MLTADVPPKNQFTAHHPGVTPIIMTNPQSNLDKNRSAGMRPHYNQFADPC